MEIAESSAFCLSSYSKLVTCLYWSALLRTLYLRSEYRGSRCKHWIPLTTANRSRLICTEEYGQAAYLGAESNLPPSQCHRAPFTQTLCRAVLPCPTLPYLPQQWSESVSTSTSNSKEPLRWRRIQQRMSCRWGKEIKNVNELPKMNEQLK